MITIHNPTRSTRFAGLKFLRRILSNIFVALTGAYGLNLMLWLALRLLVGEQWTLIAFFNSFLHLLLLPTLVLLPVCLLLRRRRLALTQLPGVVTFALVYGVLFLPQQVSVPASAPTFSLLTYNLKSETDGLDRLANVIADANADIVAMQEVSEAATAYLQTEFADEYPYQAFHPQTGEPIPGQAVLSRYPILSDEYWRIHLGHQRVTLDVNGATLTLYNAHPIQPLVRDGFIRRAEEVTDLLERAARDTGPLLLVGDFNMSDLSEDYQRITQDYTDIYREVGWGLGFTFPDFGDANAVPRALPAVSMPVRPAARLDYIFRNEAIQALESYVWSASGGSDHRPVFARLAIGVGQ